MQENTSFFWFPYSYKSGNCFCFILYVFCLLFYFNFMSFHEPVNAGEALTEGV